MHIGHKLLFVGAIGAVGIVIYEVMKSHQHHPTPSVQPQAITGEANQFFPSGLPYGMPMASGYTNVGGMQWGMPFYGGFASEPHLLQ